ncbi:MAG TPA: hypothetical protein PLM75_12385, partial [bacterium]|nr:hypothetical protein [bacterium]
DRFTFPALQKVRAEAGDTLVLKELISGKTAVTIIAKPSEPTQIFDLIFDCPSVINYRTVRIQATGEDISPNIADYVTVNVGRIRPDNTYHPDSIYIRLYQPDDKIDYFIYEGYITLTEDTHDFYSSNIWKYYVPRGDTVFVRWQPRAYSPLSAREYEYKIYITIPRPPAICSNIKVNISNNGNIVDIPNNWREDRFLNDLRVGNIMQFSAQEQGPYASNSLTRDTFAIMLVNNDYNTDRPNYRNAPKYVSAIDEDSYILIVFTETSETSYFYKSGILEIAEEFIYYYEDINKYYDRRWKDRLFIRPGDNLGLQIIGPTAFPNSVAFLRDFASFYILDQTIPGGFNYYPNPVKADNSIYGSNYLTFDNIQTNAKLKILSIDGRIVYENNAIPEYSPDGVKNRFYWDLTNKDGKKIASGIYIFITTDNTGKPQTGKIAIIR